MLGKSPETAMN